MYTLLRTILCGLVGLVLACPASADTLRLRDGREFDGQLISQDQERVVFEIEFGSSVMRQRIPAQLVDEIVTVERDGLSYAVVPIIGTIGFDPNADEFITAEGIRRAIADCKTADADIIIIQIDSPGGFIDEMHRIIEELDVGGARTVTWVKDGISAAAVIAMTSSEIVMHPSGRIGAAVPYSVGPEGTPAVIEEKWQSAIRAGFRRAAQQGGHSELLLQAMMDPSLELSISEQDDEPRVQHRAQAPFGKPITTRGQILTLTATEAVETELAVGIADSLDELREVLGIDEWHEATSRSRHAAQNHALAQRHRVEREQQRLEERRRREALRARYRAELQEIDKQLQGLEAEIASNERAVNDLYNRRARAASAIERQYQANLDVAYSYRYPGSAIAEARAIHEAELTDLVQQFAPVIAVVERDLNTARANRDALLQRWNELLRLLNTD